MATNSPLSVLGKIVFWRYPRGSWQYDILCGLILVFIFFTPRAIFDGTYFSKRVEEPAPQDEPSLKETPERARRRPDADAADMVRHLEP